MFSYRTDCVISIYNGTCILTIACMCIMKYTFLIAKNKFQLSVGVHWHHIVHAGLQSIIRHLINLLLCMKGQMAEDPSLHHPSMIRARNDVASMKHHKTLQ
jgi:hypothetical protein